MHRIKRFTQEKGLRFRSMADFGCGSAIALLELAELFPGTIFHGFEASTALVNRNRRKAAELGIRNIRFQAAELPAVPETRTFDLVLCIATLHYVENSLLALRNLFTKVKSGGHLIFNYPNIFTMHWYRRNLAEADESLKRRFGLVLSGKNVLSRRKIAGVLARPIRNFWRELGESLDRTNPCVFVSRPRGVDGSWT